MASVPVRRHRGRPWTIPSFPPEAAVSWRAARRYGVPRAMIERATARRLAGDWRGACAAAGVDVDVDLDGIPRSRRPRIEEDLLRLAPDLLRWHLPRAEDEHGRLRPNTMVLLARYGSRLLQLLTPDRLDRPQRLTLVLRPPRPGWGTSYPFHRLEDWTWLRELWDVRRLDGLRSWYGATDRVPFLRPDGTPLDADEEPPGAPLTERTIRLLERGEVEAACAAAGIELDMRTPKGSRYRPDPFRVIRDHPLDLARLARLQRDEPGRSLLILHGPGYGLLLRLREDSRVLTVPVTMTPNAVRLPEAAWRRAPDLELLRLGWLTPDDLHPLVHDALFPGRGGTPGPPEAPLPEPSRILCNGEWHLVGFRDRALQTPHGAEQLRRERLLRGLGGPVSDCSVVAAAWRRGTRRLPRFLRMQRQDLLRRVLHGDTDGVLRLLDAFDPRMRVADGRTLLHLLHLVDHERLLPRLLEAGLDVEAADETGRTPLHSAVEHGTPALVRALLAAGARPDATDRSGASVLELAERARRGDLEFLRNEKGHGR
ncbi:MAG TPA: ankyrin repeat domain-containing protein [Thermomonospora sp.]|nr:ankyrin repeat domain-containing protein [Thermomonospora sp.]